MKFGKKFLSFLTKNVEKIVDVIILISIFFFLLSYFNPKLLLSKTSISGGDTVSHFVLLHYLKNYLIPHGKLIGWYPHWFGGVPIFQFYFLFPYLVMCLLSYLTSLEVSFKLVSISGIFLLPFATYFSMKFMRFNFPAPIIAAIFSLLFLFLETNSYYGGNIPSTLAGEISYNMSFSFMILSFGLLYKGTENAKLLIPNALLLALVVLTHVYTSIMMIFVSSFFILSKKLEGLKYLTKVWGLALLLTAFWLVPFAFKYTYSSAPKELLAQVDLNVTFIQHYSVFYLLAFISVLIGLKNKDLKIFYIGFAIVSAFFLFMFANKFLHLLYIRFAPFLYFFPFLLAADCVEKNSSKLKFKTIVPIMIFLVVVIWLNKNVSYIPFWIKWNYEGLEGKTTWSEFRNTLEEMANLNESGRIVVEYSATYNKYGSPRVFEVSPVFTNKSVMEGLLLESSLTFPFYFYMQKEIAETTWWPGFPIKYPDFNLTSGADHLKLYNVKYYLVSSEKVKGEIKNNSRYQFLKEVNGFHFYQLNLNSKYVELSKNEPILVVTDNWKQISYDWFSMGYLEVPLVFVTKPDEYDIQHFRIFVLDKPFQIPNKTVFNTSLLSEALKESKPINVSCKIDEKISEEEILISTNCIDKPIIVKVSYFPNWQVSGAKKVYLISPNLMMIFPEENDVRIFYGDLFVDKIANFISLSTVFFLIFYSTFKFLAKFTNKKYSESFVNEDVLN